MCKGSRAVGGLPPLSFSISESVRWMCPACWASTSMLEAAFSSIDGREDAAGDMAGAGAERVGGSVVQGLEWASELE